MNLSQLQIPEIKVLGEVRHFKGKQGEALNAALRDAKDVFKTWLNLEIQSGGQKGWQLLECEYEAREQLLLTIERYSSKGGKAAIDLTTFGTAVGEFTNTAYAVEYMPRQRAMTNNHGRKGAAK